MKFEVYNRGEIGSINPKVPHVIISISDATHDRADVATNSNTLDVLYVSFHDVDQPRPGMDLFTEAQADSILNFYTHYREQAQLVIAHCTMGQSRSPAVLAALQKIEFGNDDVWFKSKTPNRLVYSTILQRGFDRGLFSV